MRSLPVGEFGFAATVVVVEIRGAGHAGLELECAALGKEVGVGHGGLGCWLEGICAGG